MTRGPAAKKCHRCDRREVNTQNAAGDVRLCGYEEHSETRQGPNSRAKDTAKLFGAHTDNATVVGATQPESNHPHRRETSHEHAVVDSVKSSWLTSVAESDDQ
jgi:hypothetical protein